jgi:hypothetical protein
MIDIGESAINLMRKWKRSECSESYSRRTQGSEVLPSGKGCGGPAFLHALRIANGIWPPARIAYPLSELYALQALYEQEAGL